MEAKGQGRAPQGGAALGCPNFGHQVSRGHPETRLGLPAAFPTLPRGASAQGNTHTSRRLGVFGVSHWCKPSCSPPIIAAPPPWHHPAFTENKAQALGAMLGTNVPE